MRKGIRMRKKFYSLLFAVLLSLFMVTGCSNSSYTKDKAETDTKKETIEEKTTEEKTAEEKTTEEKTTEEKTTEETKSEPKSWSLDWKVPEGFSSSDGMIYVTEDYPLDSSNITYTKSENDAYGIDFTKESYTELMASQFKAVYNLDVDINISRFEKIENNGCDGLLICSDYELSGVKLSQTLYTFEADGDVFSVCYTIVEDADWKDAFDESAKTIKMVPEY